ncbi:MAG: flavodoxin [Eubacteriales bacterium]|nr:flavodoxin [Eubacteriales bacterium]
MNILIVYFSLEGNTDYAAGKIAEAVGGDTLRLFTKKAYIDQGFSRFVWGGKSAVMAEKPELEPYDVDLGAYEMIVLGFPVWAFTFAPPLRTFIEENRNILNKKPLAAFACQSGMGAERSFAELKKCIGIADFVAEAVFIDPKAKQKEDTDKKIETFSLILKTLV